MVRTDAGETLVRIDGPSDAPPLVLLPSSGCNSLLWIADIRTYSKVHRTYAVDAIYDNGLGVDWRPVKNAAGAVAWLDGLFDALGLVGGINMLGQSMGGYVTAEYLLHAPRRVAKAVILGPRVSLSARPVGSSLACSAEPLSALESGLPVCSFPPRVRFSWRSSTPLSTPRSC